MSGDSSDDAFSHIPPASEARASAATFLINSNKKDEDKKD
jgi:hypothetical protein